MEPFWISVAVILSLIARLQTLILRRKRRNMLVKSSRRRAKRWKHTSSILLLSPPTIHTPSGSSLVTKRVYAVRHWLCSAVVVCFRTADLSASDRYKCVPGGQRTGQGDSEGARRGVLKVLFPFFVFVKTRKCICIEICLLATTASFACFSEPPE